MVSGLPFPKAMNQAKESGKLDRVFRLWEAVKARPNIAAFPYEREKSKVRLGHLPILSTQ